MYGDDTYPEPTTNVKKSLLWAIPCLIVVLLIGVGLLYEWSKRGGVANALETVGLQFGDARKLHETPQYVPDPDHVEVPKTPQPSGVHLQTPFAQPSRPPAVAPATVPRKRPGPLLQVIHLETPSDVTPKPKGPLYTLGIWSYLPCVVETILNSEVEGLFTVQITRPVLDVTRTQVLIPQGARVGAKDTTSDLLFGNERIPTFALSISLPNGLPLELGQAPILDAAGTNGLTGEVHNHVWRLLWTSVFIGGLQGGQQVLQTEFVNGGAGAIAAGISRELGNKAQHRLGRAQDTRPTIIVHRGELCQILVPKVFQLPSFEAVRS